MFDGRPIRGGRAKRYRYNLEHPESSSPDAAASAPYYLAVAGELVRRASSRRGIRVSVTTALFEMGEPE